MSCAYISPWRQGSASVPSWMLQQHSEKSTSFSGQRSLNIRSCSKWSPEYQCTAMPATNAAARGSPSSARARSSVRSLLWSQK